MANSVIVRTSRKDGVMQKVEVAATDLPQVTAPIGTIAAAGSTAADGTAAAPGANKVTGADATKGVTLPASAAGMEVFVRNDDGTSALKVWPATTGGVINRGSAGAALSVPANTACLLVAIDSSDDWFSVPRVPS
jgi:hypothetical protein